MNATKHCQAIFSNSPKHLLAKLAEDISSSNQQPFTKRWILVANTTTGHWVRKELVNASSDHIFMGSTIVSSTDAVVKHLFSSICQRDPSLPDYTTLPLLIHEALINKDLQEVHNFPQMFLSPTYSMAKQLSSTFKKFFTFSQLPSGEAHLYHKLFSYLEGLFSSYKELFPKILSGLRSQPQNQSLHIFGCSSLPKHLTNFFIDLGEFFPVHFYCFSPCKEYFGDALSDKAIDFLWRTLPEHKNTTAWEQYILADRQALLANLSHKSSISQNFFLDRDIDSLEMFLPIEGNSSLHQVQDAILHLQPLSPEELTESQQTLFVYHAHSHIREVQEVFLKIAVLLKQGVSPEEICIASSHIETYTVYLQAVFQPHIPLYFTQPPSHYGKLLKEKLLLLSSLLTQRNLQCLLQILIHPDLPHPIEPEKIPLIVRSLTKAWATLSSKNHNKKFHTLADLILDAYPFQEEFGKISLFDIWETTLPLIYHIQDFLNLYIDTDTLSYQQHFENIFSFLETAFSLSTEELSLITSLKHSLFPKFSSLSCPFSFFIDFCLDFLSRFLSSSPLYDKPGPFVGRLSELSLIPKHYTFILGANKNVSSLNPIEFSKATAHEELAFSSSEDEENFHFLQFLISTKKELHISYLSSPDSPALPSAFLKHIQDTLKLPSIAIPAKPYTPVAFFQPTQRHISQAYHYNLAKAFCAPKRPFPPLFGFSKESPKLPHHLSLAQLVWGITSPLDLFLKTHFHLNPRPPKLLGVHPKLSPTKHNISRFWEEICLEKESSPMHNLSPFLESVFSQYQKQTQLWFHNIQNSQDLPYTAVLSHALFQNLPSKSVLLPPVTLELEQHPLHIHGKIPGVFSHGLYLCAIDPNTIVKNSPKLPDTLHELKELLERYLSSALLQISGQLPYPSHIRKLYSFHAYEELPLPFSDPQDYLRNAIDVYHTMCSTPIPLLSAACWKLLNNPEKLQKEIQRTIEEDAQTPIFSLFWNFHHRDIPQELLNLDEHVRLKILSLQGQHGSF
ncbi:exodeoxyribonuclease V subunit gamma [Chlamydia pecorum]|uniref:Exodeoxyribonuclease v, gamma n=2 Tax=Chlamydia pecorum TaxID=85991 RepID=A0AA34RCS7_CHLPE|nr:exodeoxyribonuclease V subunit gamma [Chlamydia pecorum]AEB41314.1 exodeoxyribonuclease v, gamma [Chlamydia pecorum E58]ETF38667.1 exodeoxyribonuclease V subunit gamma [Chlamydia pecorum VR629]UFP06880.1 exodeoxyribonuclease V subunit gamma [Chlamydia pecorum]UJT76690.1 exodeoxyribonuclease v, gamma [Chlamydia pecorum]